MRRKLIFIVFIIITLFSIAYKNQFDRSFKNDNKNIVATSQIQRHITDDDKNEQYEAHDSRLSLKKIYKNISEIKKDADIIIEGKVINAKSEMFDELMPITYTEIEVYDVFKTDSNSLLKNSKICIIDEGGTIPKEILIKKYKSKFPDKPINPEKVQDVKSTNDGIPPMEIGEHFIVFAQRFQGKASKENCYIVLGAYQGKFKVEDGKVKHQVPDLLEEKFEDKVESKDELLKLINEK